MIILVDMDDVLEQLVKGWVEYVNEKFGTDARPEDVRSWDMSRAFPSLSRDQVYSATKDDALWDRVLPMPGAADGLKYLTEKGHEIFIVTATEYQTLRAKMDRVLFRYFPFLDWDHVIISSRKQMIAGDILIDDGPHNLTGDRKYKLLFSAGHNAGFDESTVGAVRVNSWKEVCEQVDRIAAETEAP